MAKLEKKVTRTLRRLYPLPNPISETTKAVDYEATVQELHTIRSKLELVYTNLQEYLLQREFDEEFQRGVGEREINELLIITAYFYGFNDKIGTATSNQETYDVLHKLVENVVKLSKKIEALILEDGPSTTMDDEYNRKRANLKLEALIHDVDRLISTYESLAENAYRSQTTVALRKIIQALEKAP